MDPNFDSSDVEPDVEQPALLAYAHLGAASIAKLLEPDPMDTRIESKKAVKRLSVLDTLGSPQGVGDHARWINRWLAFERSILGRSTPKAPTGEDVNRFLLQIPDIVVPKGAKYGDILSAHSMHAAIKALRAYFTFTFPDYRWTKVDSLRTKALLGSLKKQDKVTDHRKRDRQWLGILVVRAMARAVLDDALANGTYSWDVTLYKVFSMVLTASLGGRSGDVALSKGYTGLEFTKWEDVRVQMFRLDGHEALGLQIELRYCKSHKHDDDVNRLLVIGSLPDPADSVVCVVRLLLAHAMRIGACVAKNYDHLVHLVRTDPQKTLPWAHPQWPLLCAMTGHGAGLVPDYRAHGYQITLSVKSAAETAGIAVHVVAHDMRRGYFRDLAHLPKNAIQGAATTELAQAGGHSETARARGVTAEYAGGISNDLHAVRTAAPKRPNDPRALTHDPDRPFKKPRPTKKMLDLQCEKMGLPPKPQSSRRQARKALTAAAKDAWAKGEEGAHHGQPSPDAAEPSEAIPVDPELLGMESADGAEGFCDNLDSMLQEPDHPDSQALLAQCESIENATHEPAVELDVADFINQFATINLSTAIRKPNLPTHKGTSTDPPTFFVSRQPCRNKKFGCDYEGDRRKLEHHQATCSVTSVEAWTKLQAKRQSSLVGKVSCPHPGCDETMSPNNLAAHSRIHVGDNWATRKCKDCPDGEWFTTRQAYDKHRKACHSKYTPRVCPLEGCPSEGHVYKMIKNLSAHLVSKHQIHDVKTRATYLK